MPLALQHTLDFLRDLKHNNDRAWFTANRARYETARAAFEDVVTDIMERLSAFEDLEGVTPADTIYRINRDVRFSADKSPYKTAMSAFIGKGGRKATGRAYYFQVEPGGQSVIATGLYMLPPDFLEKIRQHIAADARPLRAILAADDFRDAFGQIQGEQLKTAPKGYDKNHPDLDLLRYKQFMAEHMFPDEAVLADDFAAQVAEMCRKAQPFANYFFGIIEGMKWPERERR